MCLKLVHFFGDRFCTSAKIYESLKMLNWKKNVQNLLFYVLITQVYHRSHQIIMGLSLKL